MGLLGEVEGRVKKGSRKRRERDEEDELRKMEIEKVLGIEGEELGIEKVEGGKSSRGE